MDTFTPFSHLSRSEWKHGAAIRKIDSYMTQTCYVCMNSKGKASEAFINGVLISVCVDCHIEWVFGVIGQCGRLEAKKLELDTLYEALASVEEDLHFHIAGGDNEAAHVLEDELCRSVLLALHDGTVQPGDAKRFIDLAVRAIKTGYERWYG